MRLGFHGNGIASPCMSRLEACPAELAVREMLGLEGPVVAAMMGTEYAATASGASACRHLCSRRMRDLRAFPRPRASADRAPARRPLYLPGPLQRPDVRGLGDPERAGDFG